ncbi:MAG: orotate phosphoribosyltransferase [Chitinivibrionales bacterium]|nr:orotate phosphoribosyltransferase [Chitinivibrionales bacterium]
MQQYKQDFIEFMIQSGVLLFGDFVTKSGRNTPYFINTGNYRTGSQIAQLGSFYAEAIRNNVMDDFDVVFGPAYKGIPLAITASISLYKNFGHDVAFCFNRKEAKDHGEGGSLVGHKLQNGDRVLIIEDVTTAGTSIRETMPLLTGAASISAAGLIVSVDRQEKGPNGTAALKSISETFGMKACAIVTLDEIVGHLYKREVNGTVIVDDTMKNKIDAYRKQYGA